MPIRSHRREKVFGPGRFLPLDRNAKVRIGVYARAWSARHRQPGQHHRGPISRAFLGVLDALLWDFHNSHSGVCFPGYESIARAAQCVRSTVAEALKVLEWAGVLSWHHRIARIQVRAQDVTGRWTHRWRVIRTSNAYVFRDPQQQLAGVPACKSENRSGTQNQEVLKKERRIEQAERIVPCPDVHASAVAALAVVARQRQNWLIQQATR